MSISDLNQLVAAFAGATIAIVISTVINMKKSNQDY